MNMSLFDRVCLVMLHTRSPLVVMCQGISNMTYGNLTLLHQSGVVEMMNSPRYPSQISKYDTGCVGHCKTHYLFKPIIYNPQTD
jgi:hypothetical protein